DGELVWTSPAHAGIASAIAVEQDMLLFGTGLPEALGGVPGRTGLFAYRAEGRAVDTVAATGERDRAGNGNGEPADARVVEVTATDFAFSPARIEAAPGEALALRLVNRGSVPHGLRLVLPEGEVALARPVAPARDDTLRLRAPEEP